MKSFLASDETLHINNRTGYTINEIYIAPTSTDNWEEDVMGEDALETDTSVSVDFSRSVDTGKWDLKAVYDDGTNAVWKNIDLCKISRPRTIACRSIPSRRSISTPNISSSIRSSSRTIPAPRARATS